MKLEINIDKEFVQSQLDMRSVSFSKILDHLKEKSIALRKTKSLTLPTFILDSKIIGYAFASECGFLTPKLTYVGKPLEEISFLGNTVTKPLYENSSKGVFIAYSDDNIIYLNSGERFTSSDEAKEYASTLLETRTIRRNRWVVEELLVDKEKIARDIKFYCFYGKVGLILETERESGIKRCWFDSDLNYVDTGKYTNVLFKGSRNNLDELQVLAEKLSLEIPSAFVRIDFLICNNNYYVGELTPIPGNYASFNYEWDKKLGELYIDATIQLSCDLGSGKTFDKYNQAEKSEYRLMKKLNR